ncbi:hypothetical protein [Flagellimonas nanhaiensis]|uniref:Uncharacterized protein n=1 Tax=Flagellimonas nanhaiensis TaxID=2292706 RepID=A0A371JPZ8_9FLAO|nr:hypothetical protein [Allomuricauda nanhaiensis]RDY59594.1 hypothetical protein DX873_09470 [Allomuricauda nanhaiensis]
MKTFLTILIIFVSTFCYSQDKWELVYENDAEGAVVTGELNDLISAIQNGQNIRIYFKMARRSNPEIYVEHTALVKFTTVMNSPNGQFVTGQIDPIVGQIPDYEKGLVLLKENLEWSLIASSNGNNDTMTRDVITGEIVGHKIVKWGTKWFVEKR